MLVGAQRGVGRLALGQHRRHRSFARWPGRILSSDYVPASLMESIFKLSAAEVGISCRRPCGSPRSTRRAVGLSDRGEIATGRRADLVRVREFEGAPSYWTVWRAGSALV